VLTNLLVDDFKNDPIQSFVWFDYDHPSEETVCEIIATTTKTRKSITLAFSCGARSAFKLKA
jgi:hypothetical protein